jgi:hypothetical protein
MRRLQVWAAVSLIIGIVAAVTPRAAPVLAQSACSRSADPRSMALRLDDFGRGESAYVDRDDAGYWNGQGILFGFKRDDWTEMWSSPNGAYLYGGVVVSTPESVSGDYQAAVEGWTSEWKQYWKIDAPTVGDESVMYQRMTSWEIMPETPMVETFIAFRRCNVQAHVLVATMAHFDPKAQALRYARLIEERIPR